MENIFYVGQQCVVPLFDYVHLQKGVRNNLMDKDLLINKNAQRSEQCSKSQYASWKHIQMVYEIDKHSLL